MSYLDMITFDGPSGTVAIDPQSASLVWKRGEHCEVQLISGEPIPLNIDAGEVAKALWGFLHATDNAYLNDAHVIAVVPQGSGTRLMLRGNLNLDTPTPVNQMIMSLRQMDVERASIRRGDR